MQTDTQTLAILREQIPAVMLGSIFVFVGVAALAIAAIRHRKTMRAIVWFGLFSGCYGLRLLLQSPAFIAILPSRVAPLRSILIVILTHVILIPALLVWYDLGKGPIRKAVMIMTVAAIIVGVLGIGNALITGVPYRFLPLNNVLAILFTLALAVINVVPALSKRYVAIQSPVLAGGSLVLAVAALQVNLSTFLPIQRWESFEPVAFGIFVLSVGYVAVEYVLLSEKRLLSIEHELSVAREIQNSILPTSTPEIAGLNVAATYRPATSVAGDFYEFVEIDPQHIGFLIADVSGHGVPAALIASMIKVAMHAVKSSAANPSELMKGLNRILTQQLRGQFVTAAYLYLDLEVKLARYAAAGHPPMVHWKGSGAIERVESNGLLFGVLRETEYPSVEVPLRSGDHFLLYTDGLTETENSLGEQFQARRLQAVLQQFRQATMEGLSETLFRESSAWQPASLPQQDDVTMVLVEVQ